MSGLALRPFSLRGQIVLLLTVGMSTAALVALVVVQHAQQKWFEDFRRQNVVLSATDVARRLARDPVGTAHALHNGEILGAALPSADMAAGSVDAALNHQLRARFGTDVLSRYMPVAKCFVQARAPQRSEAAGIAKVPKADCWRIDYRTARGKEAMLIWLPRYLTIDRPSVDPLYLVFIVIASASLGMLAARIATAPLKRLTLTAHAFAEASELRPVVENGPAEVRAAISTFNLMQSRLMRGVRERTQILAAVSHDLQTPLTRLRLRIEKVGEEGLREQLVNDVAAMHRLIREGLDLARSSDSEEHWQLVDIDSLLASLAEDAAEFGADVAYIEDCGGTLYTRPDALTRCLSNLIDNAVKYGASARITCQLVESGVAIRVRDKGPGLPQDRLEAVFEPFVRLESSRSRRFGGTGIGLTIARAQAQLFGATVRLTNHVDGGLLATVTIRQHGLVNQAR